MTPMEFLVWFERMVQGLPTLEQDMKLEDTDLCSEWLEQVEHCIMHAHDKMAELDDTDMLARYSTAFGKILDVASDPNCSTWFSAFLYTECNYDGFMRLAPQDWIEYSGLEVCDMAYVSVLELEKLKVRYFNYNSVHCNEPIYNQCVMVLAAPKLESGTIETRNLMQQGAATASKAECTS